VRKKRSAKEKGFNLPSFFTKEVFIVAGLLLLAFILRLIYLAHLKINDPSFYLPPPGTDMLTYHNYAQQILSGTFGKEPYYYGPLYSYFLAAIYKIFGVDPYIARLIQMILGVFTSLFIYLIARKVFNKATALISISISIFYGMFYIHEGILLLEPLATFLNTLSIFLLLRIEDNQSYKNIAFAGIAIGLSALARANILLFVPFILIWMLKSLQLKAYSLQLKRFGFLCLVILLTISPATIRNYLASGKFILISTNGPVLFWISNNPYATGEYSYPPPEYGDKIAKMVEKDGEGAYIKEVIRFFKESPRAFLKLQLRKFLLFWDRYEIENNLNYSLQRGYSSLLSLPIFISFSIVAPIGLCGIFFSLRKRKLLLHLFIFSFMSAMIIFHIIARHRLNCLPVLIIFAGFAIWWWHEKVRDKKYKILFLSLIPLIFSFLLGYSQDISKRVYPAIHPEGVHICQPEGILIRDTTSIAHGSKGFEMRDLNNMARKELVIKENISDYKKAVIWLIASIGENPGILSMQINDQEFPISFAYSRGLLDRCKIEFDSNLLKEGVNTIILKPTGRVEINLAIDNFYSFGRSYFLKDGKWKRLKKGEFMIWLQLLNEEI